MKIVKPNPKNWSHCLWALQRANGITSCLTACISALTFLSTGATVPMGIPDSSLSCCPVLAWCKQQIIVKTLLKRGCTRVARKAMHYPTQRCLTRFLLKRLETHPHANATKVSGQPLLIGHIVSFARGVVQGALLYAGSHSENRAKFGQ